MNQRSSLSGWSSGALLALAFGCAQDLGPREITEVRTAPEHRRPPIPNATAEERFAMRPMAGAGKQTAPETLIDYDLPPGWTELPTSSMRLINLLVGGDPAAECYVTFLPGGGGGLAANLNRWRGQMGLGDLSTDEIGALPVRSILGKPATYLEVDGTYQGMSGSENKADYRMVGLIHADSEMAIFIKMIGPAGLLEQHRENFSDFCHSLRPAADLHAAAGGQNITPDQPVNAGAGGLKWTLPSGWEERPSSSAMRLVTVGPIGADTTECYITILGGDGGGLVANFSRWCGQMGQPPLTQADIDALPEILVLGEPTRLLHVDGNYTSMDGEKSEEASMLAVACMSRGSSIFVKMIGPRDAVHQNEQKFQEFCASLQ